MVLESKIKRQTPVREFVVDTDKYRITLDDVTFDSDNKLLNIPLATIYHRNADNGEILRKCGHFSVVGDKFPTDTRSIHINFEYSCLNNYNDITNDIMDVIKAIEEESYVTIDIYGYEIAEMEEKNRLEQQFNEALESINE